MTGVRLSPSIVKAIDKVAASAGITRSELIRRWLLAHLRTDNSDQPRFKYWFHPTLSDALYIAVDHFTHADGDPRKNLTLSSDLRSEDEIDDAVDELIGDLEMMRQSAKASLRKRLSKGKD